MCPVQDVKEANNQSGSCEAEAVQEPSTKMDIGDETPSTSADAPMEEMGGQETDIFKEHDNEEKSPTKEDTSSNKEDSPNVSGSSDVVSGTPQKSNSRRQSFITLEKYVEGKPASPISVSRFTGPLAKNSQSQETPKSQSSIAHSPDTPQAENSPEVFMETDVCQKHLEASPVEGLKEIKDITQAVKPSSERPSESTEDEDVIPDTQTKTTKVDLACVGTPPENDVVKATPEEESDVIADSQSESSSPANPRRSGRQRIKPVRPGEESDEQEGKNKIRGKRAASNDKNTSVTKEPTPSPAETDSESKGRRRGKVVEVENVVKVRKSLRGDSDNSQSDSQSVAGESQTQGRRRSQAELLVASQNSLLNSQTQERPARRTRSLQDTDSQQLSGEAEVEGQSQGRPVRKTRRTETAMVQNESQSQSQVDSEQLGSQADGGVRVRGKRRRKLVSEEEESKNSSQNAQVENFDESQELSQGRNRAKTRRSAQLLSASAENSDSNASETGDEGQKSKKRGRRLYSMNAALTQSPQTIAQTTKNVSQELAGGIEDVQSTQTPKSATPQKSPVNNNSFVSDDQVPHLEVEILNEEKIAKQEEVMLTPKEDEDLQEDHKLEEESKEAVQMAPVTPSSVCTEEAEVEHKGADVVMDADIKPDVVFEHSPASQTSHANLKISDEVEMNISNERIDSSPDVVTSGSKSSDSQTEASESDGTAETSCPVHNGGSRKRPHLKGCICHLGLKTDTVRQSESQTSQENGTNSADGNQLPPHSEEVTSEEVEAVENINGLPDSNVPETEPDDSSTSSMPVKSPHISSDAVVEEAALPSDTTEQDKDELAVTELQEEAKQNEEPSTVLGVSEVVHVQEEQLEKTSAETVETQTLSKQEEPLAESTVSPPTETMEVQDVVTNGDEEDGVAPLVEDHKVMAAEEEETQMDNGDPTLGPTENPSETAVDVMEPTEPLQSVEEKAVCLDSPPKQKCLDALSGELEVGQSPSSGRTRGVWSPSASPSTSILKKGQKRPSEEDSPSPLLKVMLLLSCS